MEQSKSRIDKIRNSPLGVSRRQLAGYLGAAAGAAFGTTGIAMANTPKPPTKHSLRDSLQAALRSIGTAPCLAAADRLASGAQGTGNLSFHLRRAGLTAADAVRIADALAAVTSAELACLGSFSLSFNKIGDDGAIALADILPGTVPELGLVGCAVSDPGAEALLTWASNASGLRMICIENNSLSADMQNSFRHLQRKSPHLAVYV